MLDFPAVATAAAVVNMLDCPAAVDMLDGPAAAETVVNTIDCPAAMDTLDCPATVDRMCPSVYVFCVATSHLSLKMFDGRWNTCRCYLTGCQRTNDDNLEIDLLISKHNSV